MQVSLSVGSIAPTHTAYPFCWPCVMSSVLCEQNMNCISSLFNVVGAVVKVARQSKRMSIETFVPINIKILKSLVIDDLASCQ